ncbi:2TM domain-containing protein [Actinoplanes palleronii]
MAVTWWLTTPDGFFWPMFPLFGWGIGVAFHIWDVFVGSEPSEEAIRAETDRLEKR